MSDIPWAVAWYGQAQCAWLTLNAQSDFTAISDLQKPVQVLYLTQVTLDSRFVTQWVLAGENNWGSLVLQTLGQLGQTQAWPKRVNLVMRQSQSPSTSFPLHYWQAGWPDQFLLTAREHWPKPL